jgi:ribosomal protein S7
MPRKGPATRREIQPDPIYRSVVVTQLVNKILQRGKRSLAERIVYDALEIVQTKTASEPVATLKRAVDNVKPQLEVRSRPSTGWRGCSHDGDAPRRAPGRWRHRPDGYAPRAAA